MKSVTLKQTGWHVTGEAVISTWGGGQGTIRMDPTFVPLGKMTKENLHRCINDGRFGCQSIDQGVLEVSVEYEGRYREYDRTIFIDNPNPRLVCRGI